MRGPQLPRRPADHIDVLLSARETTLGLLEESFQRDATPLSRAEGRAEIAVGLGFVVAATVLLILAGDHGSWHLVPALSALAAMALAMHARFDVGAGFTPPTQLAFVPLLFSMPLGAVPLATALALAASRIPDVVSGRIRFSRLALALGNSWFTIAPVIVLAALGGDRPLGSAAVLVLAIAAQFTGDFAVSFLRERLIRRTTVAEELWLALPVYGVDAVLAPVGILAALMLEQHEWGVLPLLPLLGLLAVFARERHRRLEQMLELNNAYRGTALVLGDVVEADDGYTGEHSRSVVELALAVGRELGLPDDRQRNLEFGALLHDIGKIAIPKDIINKPGRLDPEEWAIVKTHTIEGQRMLDRVGGFMREVGTIVRSHHEWWNGTGYPDGLAGEAIPLEARIISCCDAWNAMRTTRSYRATMSFEDAECELRRGTGTQFDAACVTALLTSVAHGRPPSGVLAPAA
jgi:putative nucleotidyltransferase with HDIG domain